MKREFLQNFKVGDQPLTKEIIDAIMADNGRDSEEAMKPFADYVSIKEQLQTAKNGLKSFEGVDVAKLQGEIAALNGQLTAKDQEWQCKLDAMKFDGVLKDAITAAKGRNAAAIIGALGVDKVAALKASKEQTTDIKAALDGLKKESGYLFYDGQMPPPYSPSTGTGPIETGGNFNFGFTGIRPHGTETK